MKKGKGIFRIVTIRVRFTATCAGEGCDQQIDRGTLCHARRPGEQYFCSSCAAKQPGWPKIDPKQFVNPQKASMQVARGTKRRTLG